MDRVAATAVGLLLTLEGTVLGVGSGCLALEDSDLVSTGVVVSLPVSRPDSRLGSHLDSQLDSPEEVVMALAELLEDSLTSLGSSGRMLASGAVLWSTWLGTAHMVM